MPFVPELEQTVRYLNSTAGQRDVEAGVYWPKWHSPWWHMLLLYEMGHVELIPDVIVSRFVAGLSRMPVKLFPIHPWETPQGIDPRRNTCCHCQVGNVYQVLAARGVDVDAELPWMRPWFLRYQMADGGLNCDDEAYHVRDECPSSMVGTIAAFEAILLSPSQKPEETAFLDRAAHFMLARELRLGSDTQFNAEERVSAEEWTKLCFPRFYFYDVLRGLRAILLWGEKTQQKVPKEKIAVVVDTLRQRFADDDVRAERQPWKGKKTLFPSSAGATVPHREATEFPLLHAVSEIGKVNPFLARQWQECERMLVRL